MTSYTFTRRSFLSHSLSAGALILAVPVLSRTVKAVGFGEQDWIVSPLIRLNADNTLEILYQSPEMGQGVATSLPMLFAEEMEADWDLVSVAPLPYGLKRTPNGGLAPQYIPQAAGGSVSIPRNWPLARKAGAEARQILLQAGSKYFDVPVEMLRAEKSFIIHPSGKKVAFGDLINLAAKETIEESFELTLKEKKDWNLIGTSQKQKERYDIVTGKTVYGIDADYPNVKIAVIARCPYLDGYPISYDDKKARDVEGVIDIILLPRPNLEEDYTYLAAGVAVIAETFWAAKKARDLLEIEWDKGPYSDESSESLNQHFSDLLQGKGQIVRKDGNFDEKIKQASKVVKRTYKMPYVSHAQLEPQNCIAHVEEDWVTILGPLQSPGNAGHRAHLLTGIDRLKMDVRYTRLGGGFGRRLTTDHAAEAVAISKATKLPIKVMWTREDDFRHDYYRPAGHQELIAGLDDNGKIIAWSQRLASTSKFYRRNGITVEDYWYSELYENDFPRGLIQDFQNEYFSAKSGMPRGSWRAPAHTVNAFAIQSFLDEIAIEINEDPLDFRLKLLGPPKKIFFGEDESDIYETNRLANVLKIVAQKANWGKKMPKDHAQGIASHFTFGGYCAHVAEIKMLTDTTFKVLKVYTAVDVGIVVNAAGVRAQIEGAINDGLNAALGQEIEVSGGQVMNDNFHTYSMMRIVDSVPEIDISVVESDEKPSGIGEIPLPPLVPAVTNALVRAGGKRLRSHPLSKGV